MTSEVASDCAFATEATIDGGSRYGSAATYVPAPAR